VEPISIDSLEQLHRRRSAKWRTFPKDVLPLPVAEMDFPVAEPIKQILHEMIDASDLGYSSIVPELAEAFAGFARRNWNWDIDLAQFTITSDVAVAGVEVLRKFTKPGDKIALSTPVYYSFFAWIDEVAGECVDVPLVQSADQGWALDFSGLEAAFAAGVTAYILCNPHNPVGYIPSRLELEHLADLADEYGVLIISDEIHAPLIYDGNIFTPYLSLNSQSRRTGVVVTSASKAWNIAGLKCAQIITADSARAEALKTLAENIPWRSSLLGAWASVAAYNDSQDWLNSARALLAENRQLVDSLLTEHLPRASYRMPDATYLAWIDLSAYRAEKPAAYILETARIAFSEGSDYGPAGRGHIRLNFATSPEIITEAITRTAQIFKD